jgi:adenylate kinase family enzyme
MQDTVDLIFFHGKPASGKDTQANRVIQYIPSCVKVSGVYRSTITKTGEFAKYHSMVKPYILPIGEGIDIPGQIVSQLLQSIVGDKMKEGARTIVVCGLLRTCDHLINVDKWIDSEKKFKVRTHNIYYATLDGHSLIRSQVRLKEMSRQDYSRPEDNEPLVKARLMRYRDNTGPMLKMLLADGRLKIIRADREIEEVYRDTVNVLELEGLNCHKERTLPLGSRA